MIREHEVKDLTSIVDIWYQSSLIAHSFLKDEFVEKVKEDMRNIYVPNSETWVYEENNKVIGFISLMGNEIAGLFVLPDNQSKGIGAQLVDYVSDDHKVLEVEVFEKNSIGRAFYNKYGFVFMKQYFHEESGEEVIRLKSK